MRNALIVLAVVALVLLFVAAFNTGVRVDVDYVVGTWTGAALTWILVLAAGLLLVAGMVGAVLARAGCSEARRKLEKELETTYRRLRAAEAALPAPAPAAGGEVGEAPTLAAEAPTPAAEAPTQVTEAEAPTVSAEAAEAPTTVSTAPDEAAPAADRTGLAPGPPLP